MPYTNDEVVELISVMTGKLDIVIGSGLLGATWDIPIRFVSSPDPDEIIDFFAVATSFTLKAGMPGSIGIVGINPTSNYVITIRSGGTVTTPGSGTIIGTISVSVTGLVTFATAGGVDVTVPVGLLKFVAPNPLDSGIYGLCATIKV